MMKLAPVYLGTQGLGALAWWLGLLSSETMRGWYLPRGARWDLEISVLLLDLAVLSIGSLFAASLIRSARPEWLNRTLWILVGAAGYATFVAIAWLSDPVTHWSGAVAMIPALVITTVIAVEADRLAEDTH